MARPQAVSRVHAINRFFESGRGVIASWVLCVLLVLLLLHAGWVEWRNRPLGKPATLLFVNAEPAGADLVITFALSKTRDCDFRSSRWVEKLDTAERWYLATGEASSVDPGDDTVKRIRFTLPPGLPPGEYAFRTKGLYTCPDGLYESDPSFARFTIPGPSAAGAR